MAELTQKNQEQAKVIEQQAKTIYELQQKTSRRKPKLDNLLKQEIRHSTKTLSDKGDNLDLHSSISDSHNQQVLTRIAEGACGSDKKFSEEQAMEAAQRHFINLRDELMRKLNGTSNKHAVDMRKHSRKEKKLKFRRGGLAHHQCSLSQEQKFKANQIMTMDYMSSDDDQIYTDEGGLKYRQVKRRTWESREASYYKSVAYDTYVNHMVHKRDRKKVHLLRRDENSKLSETPCPSGAPAWAIDV